MPWLQEPEEPETEGKRMGRLGISVERLYIVVKGTNANRMQYAA